MLPRLNKALWQATILCGIAAPALAAATATTPLITASIDEGALVTLAGNHAAAIATSKDLGPVAASHAFPHVTVTLKRSAAAQAALDQLVADQQTRGNAHYHRWESLADLRGFGPAQADIDKVIAWLTAHDLAVNSVSPTGMSIDVAGTAAQFEQAFHAPVHNYMRNGQAHVAATTDAAIPAALTPVLAGVTLANFFPHPNVAPTKPVYTVPTGGAAFYAVAPFDFNTIYNVNPLLSGENGFRQTVTGAAITIAVVEQTNMLSKDWQRFRSYFGLSGYSGQLRPLHPGGCTNPGFTGDEAEAAIDVEWAGAAAPDADIVEASCASTELTSGVTTTFRNLVEGDSTNATIYSISYGLCEQEYGLSGLADWANLSEEGAARGISIVVSAGDSGSSCDADASYSQNGLGVNGLASNQYVTSIGGTDFYDTALGSNHTYWTGPNSGFGRSSAKSYVPEIPWDNSCASSIIAKVQASTTGITYCNETAVGPTQNGVGGTGGASVYYAKPGFQKLAGLTGMPKDGVRDQPDISFFAANGIWNHAYLICMSDESEGGAPCTYTGVNFEGEPNALLQAYGGTSVAAPAFAGILALETQVKGATLGPVNARIYELAQQQFGNAVLAKTCNATLGQKSSNGCIFHSVTAGNNAEPCYSGTTDCFTNALSVDGIGILSANPGKNEIDAYPAAPGYNLATGLGSLNVANFLYNY